MPQQQPQQPQQQAAPFQAGFGQPQVAPPMQDPFGGAGGFSMGAADSNAGGRRKIAVRRRKNAE